MSQIALHQIEHIKISLIRLSLLPHTEFSIFLSSINSTLVAMSHAHNKHFLEDLDLLVIKHNYHRPNVILSAVFVNFMTSVIF